MAEFFKNLRKNLILTSVAYIVLGILMIVFTQQVSMFACYVIGALILAFGVIRIVGYAKNDGIENIGGFQLALGIVAAIAGLCIIAKPDIVNKFLSYVAGAVIIADGALKLQRSIDLKRTGVNNWWSVLALSVIAMLAGAVILIRPDFIAGAVIKVIGAIFIFSGVSDLWTTICVSRDVKNIIRDSNVIETEGREVGEDDD